MAKIDDKFKEVTGITSANDTDAAKSIELAGNYEGMTVAAINTDATGLTTGAKIQYTLDGSNWLDATSDSTANAATAALGPVYKVRLAVTDATWSLQVLQRINRDAKP